MTIISNNNTTYLFDDLSLDVIELGERVGRDDPEIIVEDHLTEHSLASQQHRDVPVETVAPSQHYHVWVTLNYDLIELKFIYMKVKFTSLRCSTSFSSFWK